MQAGLDTLLPSAPPHLKQHCEGGRGEQAVIIQLQGEYCKIQSDLDCSIGKCLKVYFFISSGEGKCGVCLYLFTVCVVLL